MLIKMLDQGAAIVIEVHVEIMYWESSMVSYGEER